LFVISGALSNLGILNLVGLKILINDVPSLGKIHKVAGIF
jgi:hypothetical protein